MAKSVKFVKSTGSGSNLYYVFLGLFFICLYFFIINAISDNIQTKIIITLFLILFIRYLSQNYLDDYYLNNNPSYYDNLAELGKNNQDYIWTPYGPQILGVSYILNIILLLIFTGFVCYFFIFIYILFSP